MTRVRFLNMAGTSERLILKGTLATVVEDGENPARQNDQGVWKLRVEILNGIYRGHDHADSGVEEVNADQVEVIE